MTTLDYLINAALVLLVLRQLHERRLDLHNLVAPMVLVGIAAHNYLHSIPTGGNDLLLIGSLTAVGATLGTLCATFTHVRAGQDGVALARAGWAAATLWIAGIGSRMAFSYLAAHGFGASIAHFSVTNHITGSAAWTAAFVLMALAEVTARLVTLYWRGHRVSRWPDGCRLRVMHRSTLRNAGPAAAGPSPFYRCAVMANSDESLRVRDARRRGMERVRRQRSWFRPLGAGLVAIVIASTADGHPAPAWHGTGAWLSLALIVWVGGVAATLTPASPPRADLATIALIGFSGVAIAALQHRGATEIPASVAVWLAVTRLERRRAVALSLLVTAGLAVALAANHGSSASVLAAVLLCVLLGVMAQAMRQARESEDRAELLVAQLEDAREEQANAAALAERGRIAGELHDLLAHSLSGAAIQLQGARLLADREQAPAAVREAIDRGSELVRSGLLDARRAVATLRGADPPGARDIGALVQRFAGDMHVHAELRVDGVARPLGAQAELAVYRAAQEALTNAARHAPQADVLVRLHYGEQTTALRVVNRLSSTTTSEALRGVGGGQGLRGMRERVEGLGGHMSAGPRGEDWVVELELPG